MRRTSIHPTVLLLGSRTGGLFRSQTFLEAVQRLSERTSQVSSQQDRFADSYHFLNRIQWGEREMDSHLTGFLQHVEIQEADQSLAQLVLLKLFDVIVTTNIDSLLEQALKQAGLREPFDFDVVWPEHSQDFHPGGQRLYTRILRPFGSLAARSYRIVKRSGSLDHLKPQLEETLGRDILVVGLDAQWDEEILRLFLPNQDSSLWFVHENPPLADPAVSRIFEGRRQSKFIQGEEGSYDTFFPALFRHLMGIRSAQGIVTADQPLLLSPPAPGQPSLSAQSFVNRAPELQTIDEAFATLADPDYVLKSPILAFYGIGGIGKTAILQQVLQRCQEERLPSIHLSAQEMPGFAQTIVEQVGKYLDVQTFLGNDSDWLDRSAAATNELLKRGPAVMLVDSLDPTHTEQMRWLEELLGKVLLVGKVLVVLTSKRQLLFERDRSVTSRLKSLELKPLDRESCRDYLSEPHLQLEAEVRDLVYEWTHGYPLAMQVMKESIAAGLDPRKEDERRSILETLIEQVITQKVLAHVNPTRHAWYQTILRLLSIPRHSNLELMRTLIEQFAPEYRRTGRLAYMPLPREINVADDMLSWNISGAGFSVNTSVRHLFLLDLKTREPERYRSIHLFLANLYYERMKRTLDVERVRCLREYIYHLASKGDEIALVERLREAIERIKEESPEELLPFFNEFELDQELQEALGVHKKATISLIRKTQAQIYWEFAREATGTDRVQLFSLSFEYLMQDQETSDLAQMLTERILQVRQEESPIVVQQLFGDLSRIERFRMLLNLDVYQVLLSQIPQIPPEEQT